MGQSNSQSSEDNISFDKQDGTNKNNKLSEKELADIKIFKSAIIQGNLKVFKYMVSKGIDVHLDNEFAFKYACAHGYLKIVKFIFNKGIDIDICNKYGLKNSTEGGHIDVVNFLLAKKNISISDNILINTATRGHVEVVKILLKHDVNLHANNDCALRWAAESNHIDVVKVLLHAGADIHADNDYVINISKRYGYTELEKLFETLI